MTDLEETPQPTLDSRKWDEETRAAVVRHMGLAMKFAGDFHRRHPKLDFGDLLQEAAMGIARAHQKFDPSLGNQFSTYASIWVFQFMQNYAALQNVVHVPHYLQDRLRSSSREEIADDPFLSLASKAFRTIPLVREDRTRGGQSDSFDPTARTEAFIDPWEIEKLQSSMDRIDKRSREILCMRYGIGCDPHTLEDVGKKLGVTRERVRQIELTATAKLRILMTGLDEQRPTRENFRATKKNQGDALSEIAIRVARSFGVSWFSTADTEILEAIAEAASLSPGFQCKTIVGRLRASPGRMKVSKARSARSHNDLNRFTLPSDDAMEISA